MSAMPQEPQHPRESREPTDTDTPTGRACHEETVPADTSVEVRRNAGLAALIGAAGSAIAIGYLWRATESGAFLDWVLCVLLGLIGGFHLAGLVDARTPLLVADTHGVRVRLGGQWRGLPWDAVASVVVSPRRGPLRDGCLSFSPHSLARALDGLDARGRRAASLNTTLHGAALAVPMGLTTRVSVHDETALVETLVALARGRTEVVVLPGDAEAPTDPPAGPTESVRRLVGGIATVVSRAAKGRSHDLDASAPAAVLDTEASARQGLRETNPGRRAEVTRPSPASAEPAVEGRELHRPGRVDLVVEAVDVAGGPGVCVDPRVRPISKLGDPVEPLVVAELTAEPAADPVIGSQLAAARTRVGLSVDELAERTRIRPHVIEAIEVDDFAPCGGDFYARGHLRTLARVLGQDPSPLLERFDNRYATAPVNARRVFEAELATGTTGSIRSTVGGPNWGLLVGAVLVMALVWGLVRLFATPPQPPLEPLATAGNGTAISHSARHHPAVVPPARLPVTLTATGVGSRVVVRNGDGKVVYAKVLAAGRHARLAVRPPVHVWARHAGAVSVAVHGHGQGILGRPGHSATRTFRSGSPRR